MDPKPTPQEISTTIIDALGEQGARELLGLISGTDAERAETIANLYTREDGRWIAELLMDLEGKEGELARWALLDMLRDHLEKQ